jgi:hypothetical protein
MKCCNKDLYIKNGKQNGENLFYAVCPICNKKAKGKTKKDLEQNFNNTNNMEVIKINQKNISSWQQQNMPMLMKQAAQFIDKPATKRMIEKNIQYIVNLPEKSFKKIWATPEGQQSIANALMEANYMAATLGQMGDIVPYGGYAEFIPSVECYEFALTTGKNAPFSEIEIIAIYENDQKKAFQKDGSFNLELNYGFPRGELQAIVVKAKETTTGKVIGDIYDVERLLEKAKTHSKSYKAYLRDHQAFLKLKLEGKLNKDKAGRECLIEKIEYSKNGKKESFDKFIYEDDLKNPYDGPDRPEMLRKAAGKTFFRPYMRTRNATAMAEEWEEEMPENREKAADVILNKAADQFETIIDAEEIKEKEKIKNNLSEEDLFNED